MLSHLGLESGRILVVGVSGGADSLALLGLLRDSNYPLICASFNHRLRPEADTDVAHVRSISERMGIPFVTDSVDVAAYAGAEGLSAEEAARELRYRFLFREARKAEAQAVAVGHTADDQAETVLMHFIRGAGLSGLKGMTPLTVLPVFDAEIPLVRPILGMWRHETEAYCRANGLDFLTDSTNADTIYFRNRLRHELIPLLATYNPNIKENLTRTAHALQGDHDALTRFIDAMWGAAVREIGPGYVMLDLSVLHNAADGVRRNLLRRAAFQLRPGLRDVDFEALRRASALKAGDWVGGLYTRVEEETFIVAAYEADLPSGEFPQISVEIPLTMGENPLGGGWVLSVEEKAGDDVLAEARLNGDPYTAYLDADLVGDKLRVRQVRSGNRFQPLGMSDAVKLSDLFVNLKIPQRMRARWPLVCVGDEIAWVGGLRLADGWKVVVETRRALVLKISRAG